MSERLIGAACLVVSLGAHALVLERSPHETASRVRPAATSLVRFSVVAPPPALVAAPAPPPPAPAARKPLPRRAPQAAPQPEAAPPVAAETEVATPELSGTTLVSDAAAAGWSAPQGSGETREGPIHAQASRREGPPLAATRGPSPPKPLPATPLTRLSKKPVPPPLEAALKRNYPASARSQGKSGEAKVRARIEPNGSVTLAKVTFETSDGFGSACRHTLLASKWSAPLDDGGKPVATWVTYRCKFRVD
jgi:TonB family protein